MIDQSFSTTHFGLAAFLRYVGKPHLITTTTGTPEFTFADDGECRRLAGEFFSDESVQVGNARQLLESSRDVRSTVSLAAKSPNKMWYEETQE